MLSQSGLTQGRLQGKVNLQAPSSDGFRNFLVSLDSEDLAEPAARIGILVNNREKKDVVVAILRKCQATCALNENYSNLYHFVTRLNAMAKNTLFAAMEREALQRRKAYRQPVSGHFVTPGRGELAFSVSATGCMMHAQTL